MGIFDGKKTERERGKTVALISVTKDGKGKVVRGKDLERLLAIIEQAFALASLYGGLEGDELVSWEPLESVRYVIERRK
ncbi:hypothetical protein KJ591_01155 [Patescibacteria group bacterium]|nr:hypothetical protein [Patescibacteria group bacterium]MBU4022952.1 hypothetical protein [Patescibacteria group bacterium]MBU4162095.1 hypothetical protein [Patescibacteria group bacterium]